MLYRSGEGNLARLGSMGAFFVPAAAATGLIQHEPRSNRGSEMAIA
jgi:hypothetical protein